MADGGRNDDEFDRLVLDDDFVRGATVTELDAKRRRKQSEAAEKHSRRSLRRARRRRALFNARTGSIAVAIVLLVLVGAGYVGAGPLRWIDSTLDTKAGGDDTEVAGAAAAPQSTIAPDAAATSTTTDIELVGRDYRPGDCVIWSQDANAPSTRGTRVVPCTDAHILEITGHVAREERFGKASPTADEWSAWYDTGPCRGITEQYLGRGLNPDGRWHSSGIHPTEEGWAGGDRDVWCGIGARSRELLAPDVDVEWSGRATKDDQALYIAAGQCLGEDDGWVTWHTVSCDGPHAAEVTGHVDLSAEPANPDHDEAVKDRVFERCRALAVAYTGGALRGTVDASFLGISDEGWAWGERTVECIVGEWRLGRLQNVTHRFAKAPPA